ncbi:hypothetical protein J3R30DRAFT_223871 [Lentinula aciculospora]|uniref:C2H2-type domain-containing protein n=1 Tax=Lentinula aciculospora TaxID=153920 RepID=A0A9W9DMH5_9AGAR|nr:hypothetical protein J3R30DRAFT_223871 [Lentinula aciculospora]
MTPWNTPPPFRPSSPSPTYSFESPFWSMDSGVRPDSPTFISSDTINADDDGRWPIGWGRGRSLSSSAASTPWRSRSPSVASFQSEGYYPMRSRGGSVVSVASESSFGDIDSQLLSNSSSTTQFSPTTCSSESGASFSLSSHEPGNGSDHTRHTQVATRKIRMASEHRRKKRARFYCEVPDCYGSFTAKHNLINHMNSHDGVRNFKCNLCQRKFVTSAVMKRHGRGCYPSQKRKTN